MKGRKLLATPLSRLKGATPLIVPTDWTPIHTVPSDPRLLWDEVVILASSNDASSDQKLYIRINGCSVDSVTNLIAGVGYYRILADSMFFPGDMLEAKAQNPNKVVLHGHALRATEEE